LNQVYSK